MTTLTLEPTWEIAHLFPPQGMWTEAEYLALDTNHLVELNEYYVEVLPMAAQRHQLLVAYLVLLLRQFAAVHQLGVVLFAPLPMRLWAGKMREPDVLFMFHHHAERRHEQYWDGADLVMEVVSPDDPKRDWEIKRLEYAEAGIPEYWIVDPRDNTISVLVLQGGAYVARTYGEGETAASELLDGFTAEVSAVFAQAEL